MMLIKITCFILCVTYSNITLASWVRQNLSLQVIIKQNYNHQTFSTLRTDKGYVKYIESLNKHELTTSDYDFFAELGLFKGISFYTTAYASVFKDSMTNNRYPKDNKTITGNTIVNSSFGIRQQLFKNNILAASTKMSYISSGVEDLNYYFIFGNKPSMVEFGAAIGFGTSEAFNNRLLQSDTKLKKIFIIFDNSYKLGLKRFYREMSTNITLGYELKDIGAMFLIESFNTLAPQNPLSSQKFNQYTLLLSKLSTSFVFNISSYASLQLSFSKDVGGQNRKQGNGLSLGIWFND
jgi:hypothetical protein